MDWSRREPMEAEHGRVRAGGSEAFGALVEEHQVAVYNLCYRMLGDAHLAEDAAQESFLRAFRALERYDPTRSVRTWLLSIAAHHCIDELRHRARLAWLPLGDSPIPDPAASPEAAVVQREARRDLQHLLEVLKPDERAAIILRYWYDLSVDEIAEVMKTTGHATRTRLYRARRHLAEAGLTSVDPGKRNYEPRAV